MEPPGIVVAFSAVIRDTTRRKQVERALVQTEKLASVGRLASSIAHEINNPLESVTNLLYILQSRVSDEEAKSLVATAQEELARVTHIATQTLRFYKQTGSRSEADPHSLIESVLGLYRGRLQNSGIQVINDSSDCLPLVCYENELRQVLMNLVANSFDAMRSGGRLTIRCRRMTHWSAGTNATRISVADTGIGMDAATLQRVFEPFFSTKGIGGVGLGLWISKDLVEKNGGTMRMRSSRRSGCTGTTVMMWFPDTLPCSE
jgi:signal transduction histidine kinase